MGIFDGETDSYAFIGSSAVLEYEDYSDIVKASLLTGIKNPAETVSGNIIAGVQMSIVKGIKKYEKFGFSNYLFPPPRAWTVIYNNFDAEIEKRISEENGGDRIRLNSVSSVNAKYDSLSAFNPGEGGVTECVKYIFAEWLQKNKTVTYPNEWNNKYLLTEDNAYFEFSDYTETFHNKMLFTAINTSVRVFFRTTAPTIYDPSVIIGITSIDIPAGEYWYVTYTNQTTGSTNNYWTYYVPSKKYPEIKSRTSDALTDSAEYLPVTLFIIDKTNWLSVPRWTNDNRALLNKLNLDADEIWQGMLASGLVTEDLWDLAIHFGCPINNSPSSKLDKIIHAYLYHHFERFGNRNGTYLTIGGPSGYNNSYTWTALRQDFYTTRPSNFGQWEASQIGNPGERNYFSFSVWEQLPDGRYGRIRVAGLEQSYLTNTKDGPKLAYVDSWDNLYVDISVKALEEVRLLRKEQFLQSCLRGTAIVVEQIKKPWYASGFWKAVFVIITIVVVVVTWQIQLAGGLAAVLGLGANIATTVVTLAAKFAVGFLIQFSSALVFEDSFIATIISTVVTAVLFSGAVSLTNYFEGFLANFATLDTSLKTIFSTVMQGLQLFEAYRKESVMADMEDSYTDLLETPMERQERLEEEWLGTEGGSKYDPHIELTRRLNMPLVESPAQYMARTTNTNPGQALIEEPANYVNAKLQLPRQGISPECQIRRT